LIDLLDRFETKSPILFHQYTDYNEEQTLTCGQAVDTVTKQVFASLDTGLRAQACRCA
jgi:hypothetical protein